MDLTFHVPMQHCSSQHQTLLPSPVTSTAGCYFCFGSISSFFLELFLHCIGHLLTWRVHLSVSYLFAFSYCSWILKARMLKWFAVPFSKDHISSELSTMTHQSWVALHGSLFY